MIYSDVLPMGACVERSHHLGSLASAEVLQPPLVNFRSTA